MNRRLVPLLVAAALVTPSSVLGAAQSDRLVSDYTVTSWVHANDLRLGTIYSIAQDHDGYLWIGADTGLLRFDGLRFSPWHLLSESPLPETRVSAVCVSRDGSIWVGMSDGGGVYRIRGLQADRVDDRTREIGSVRGLVEERAGAIIAVTEDQVLRFRQGAWEELPLHVPPTAAYINVKGELLIGTRQGVLRYINSEDRFVKIAPWFTWALSEDHRGQLWTTDILTGFRRVTPDAMERATLIENRGMAFDTIESARATGNGTGLLHDHRGNLWVATFGQGLWRVRQGNDGMVVENAPGMSRESVQSVIEDREGNVWVGTTSGLHRLSPHRLMPLDIGFVTATESAYGSMWAGTWNGLIELSPRNGEWRPQPATGIADWFYVLHRDAKGTLWTGSSRGLGRVINGRWQPVSLPTSSPITSITSDASGRLWVATVENLFRWEQDHLERFEAPAVADISGILFIRGDKSGRLWIAFEQGRQLGFLDPDGQFRLLSAGGGFDLRPRAIVREVFEDTAGRIWIARDDGLSRLDNDRVLTIGNRNGLPGDRVWAIIEDQEGQLWLSMDLGIVRVRPEALLRTAADPAQRLRYQFYDASDGLVGGPIGSVRASRSDDGTLWFIRSASVTLVAPRALREHPPATGPVVIETALTDGTRMVTSPDATVPSGVKRLEISYTAVTLTSPTKVRFRYHLDGFDADWIDAGTRREVVYTNLPPRDYLFRVEAMSGEGTWSESSAAWRFRIQPMFYQTRSFYAACLLGALGCTVGVWRLRLRLMRKQFAAVLGERTRMSHEIHDTLLQSLVGVALQFDDLYRGDDTVSASVRARILQVRQQVQAYIRDARQSIADLRSPVLESKDLLAALRDFGHKATQGTLVRFVSQVEGTPRRYAAALENQLLRIGQEAITNAVRHARAASIELELRFDGQSAGLRVADDGCGFDVESSTGRNGHYGLVTMKERAEQLGGTLVIDTAPGRGTRVEVRLPLTVHG